MLIIIIFMMLNNNAPCNKILYTFITTLNKITTTCSIDFAKTLFWKLKLFKTRKYALVQFMTKTKKADNCKRQPKHSRLNSALFSDMVQKKNDV